MSRLLLEGSFRSAPKTHPYKGKEIGANTILTASMQTPTALSQDAIDKLVYDVQHGLHTTLTPDDLPAVLGSTPEHLREIQGAVRSVGLTLMNRSTTHAAFGIQRVRGTYAKWKKFSPGLELRKYFNDDGEIVIDHEGDLSVLSDLPIVGLFGLRQRPIARPKYRLRQPTQNLAIPSGTTSRGLLKILGWDLKRLDELKRLTAYISLGGDNVKITKKQLLEACKLDKVSFGGLCKWFGVNGAKNGSASDDSTVENLLDLLAQALGNLFGGCLCFQGNNTDDDFNACGEEVVAFKGIEINGVFYKISDCSVSWGMAESNNTEQSLQRVDRIGDGSQLVGIDFWCASGDDGPKDRTSDYTPDAWSSRRWMGGSSGIGFNFEGGRATGRFPWNDTANGGGQTGFGISASCAPLAQEARLHLPVSAKTGKAGHCASLLSGVAQPACGPYLPGYGEVGGTSHSAPQNACQSSAVKAAHSIPSLQSKLLEEGETMCLPITIDDKSDPYPTDVANRKFEVQTGFGILNPSVL